VSTKEHDDDLVEPRDLTGHAPDAGGRRHPYDVCLQCGLKRFLDPRWHDYHDQYGDSLPPEGGPPGSSLPFLREHLLDEWGIDLAINNRLGPIPVS